MSCLISSTSLFLTFCVTPLAQNLKSHPFILKLAFFLLLPQSSDLTFSMFLLTIKSLFTAAFSTKKPIPIEQTRSYASSA